jgi:hypothetical protein
MSEIVYLGLSNAALPLAAGPLKFDMTIIP